MMDFQEKEIKTLKFVTIFAVSLACSVLILASFATVLVFLKTYRIKAELDYELRFCVSKSHDLWDDLIELHQLKNVKPRKKRQYFMDFCQDVGNCGGPQPIACADSGPDCSNNVNSFVPQAQHQTFQRPICIYGPPGPPGFPGMDGMDGTDGEPGLPGQPGVDTPGRTMPRVEDFCFTCPPAKPGAEGPSGPKGSPGDPGPTGGKCEKSSSKGAPGSTGPPGDRGDPGLPGRPGDAGKPGAFVSGGHVDGPSGPAGPPGPIGPPGPRGMDGRAIHGNAGTPGAKGGKGPPGRPGPRGNDGPAGKPGVGGDCSHCPNPRTSPGYFD